MTGSAVHQVYKTLLHSPHNKRKATTTAATTTAATTTAASTTAASKTEAYKTEASKTANGVCYLNSWILIINLHQ